LNNLHQKKSLSPEITIHRAIIFIAFILSRFGLN